MISRNLSKFLLLLVALLALTEGFSHLLCKSERYPFVRLTEQERTLLQTLSKDLHTDKTTCVQETTTLTPAELEEYKVQLRVLEALSPSAEEEAYMKVLMDRTGTSTLEQLQEKLGLKERKTFMRRILEKIGLFREKPSTSALSHLSLEPNQATLDLLNKLKVPLAEKSFFAELRDRVGCAADATLDEMKAKVDKWLEAGKEKLGELKEKTVEGAEKAKEKLGELKEKTADRAEHVKETLGDLKERTVQGAETVKEKIKEAGEHGIDALKEKSEELRQKAKETYEGAKEKMEAAAETVKEKKDELKEKAASAAETLKEKAVEGAENIKEKAAEGAEAVKETVEKTQHAAADWLKEKAETLKEGFQRAKDTTEQLKEAGAEKVKGIICEETVHDKPNCPGVAL